MRYHRMADIPYKKFREMKASKFSNCRTFFERSSGKYFCTGNKFKIAPDDLTKKETLLPQLTTIKIKCTMYCLYR